MQRCTSWCSLQRIISPMRAKTERNCKRKCTTKFQEYFLLLLITYSCFVKHLHSFNSWKRARIFTVLKWTYWHTNALLGTQWKMQMLYGAFLIFCERETKKNCLPIFLLPKIFLPFQWLNCWYIFWVMSLSPCLFVQFSRSCDSTSLSI